MNKTANYDGAHHCMHGLGKALIVTTVHCKLKHATMFSLVCKVFLKMIWYGEGVTKRCRLFLLANSAPSYMSKNAGRGGSSGVSASEYTAVHRSPNKLWRSNSIFNLWVWYIFCSVMCYKSSLHGTEH
jgi:hypothetical protein